MIRYLKRFCNGNTCNKHLQNVQFSFMFFFDKSVKVLWKQNLPTAPLDHARWRKKWSQGGAAAKSIYYTSLYTSIYTILNAAAKSIYYASLYTILVYIYTILNAAAKSNSFPHLTKRPRKPTKRICSSFNKISFERKTWIFLQQGPPPRTWLEKIENKHQN